MRTARQPERSMKRGCRARLRAQARPRGPEPLPCTFCSSHFRMRRRLPYTPHKTPCPRPTSSPPVCETSSLRARLLPQLQGQAYGRRPHRAPKRSHSCPRQHSTAVQRYSRLRLPAEAEESAGHPSPNGSRSALGSTTWGRGKGEGGGEGAGRPSPRTSALGSIALLAFVGVSCCATGGWVRVRARPR